MVEREEVKHSMMKFLALAVAITMIAFFLAQSTAFGQTATPTPTGTTTPTPTTTVPSGAPATGFGPY